MFRVCLLLSGCKNEQAIQSETLFIKLTLQRRDTGVGITVSGFQFEGEESSRGLSLEPRKFFSFISSNNVRMVRHFSFSFFFIK